MNAYRGFCPTALLALERNVAEEGIPAHPLTLKQERERIISNSAAGARQTEECIALGPSLHQGSGSATRNRFPLGHDDHGAGNKVSAGDFRSLTSREWGTGGSWGCPAGLRGIMGIRARLHRPIGPYLASRHTFGFFRLREHQWLRSEGPSSF